MDLDHTQKHDPITNMGLFCGWVWREHQSQVQHLTPWHYIYVVHYSIHYCTVLCSCIYFSEIKYIVINQQFCCCSYYKFYTLWIKKIFSIYIYLWDDSGWLYFQYCLVHNEVLDTVLLVCWKFSEFLIFYLKGKCRKYRIYLINFKR